MCCKTERKLYFRRAGVTNTGVEGCMGSGSYANNMPDTYKVRFQQVNLFQRKSPVHSEAGIYDLTSVLRGVAFGQSKNI